MTRQVDSLSPVTLAGPLTSLPACALGHQGSFGTIQVRPSLVGREGPDPAPMLLSIPSSRSRILL